MWVPFFKTFLFVLMQQRLAISPTPLQRRNRFFLGGWCVCVNILVRKKSSSSQKLRIPRRVRFYLAPVCILVKELTICDGSRENYFQQSYMAIVTRYTLVDIDMEREREFGHIVVF